MYKLLQIFHKFLKRKVLKGFAFVICRLWSAVTPEEANVIAFQYVLSMTSCGKKIQISMLW